MPLPPSSPPLAQPRPPARRRSRRYPAGPLHRHADRRRGAGAPVRSGNSRSAPITSWRRTGRSFPWCRRTGGHGMRAPGTGGGSATSTAGRSAWNWSTPGMNGATGHFPTPRWRLSPNWPVGSWIGMGFRPTACSPTPTSLHRARKTPESCSTGGGWRHGELASGPSRCPGRRAGLCRGGGPGPAGAVRLRGRANRSSRPANPSRGDGLPAALHSGSGCLRIGRRLHAGAAGGGKAVGR